MSAPFPSYFPETSWTLIARASGEDPLVVEAALADIYSRYRFPLYCYLRGKRLAHQDAEDVLQDFFARFIRLRSFQKADQEKGRLRGYLMTSLERCLIDWRSRSSRRLPAQDASASGLGRRYEGFITREVSPDLAYERSWAVSVLHASLDRLGAHYECLGKLRLFEVLRPVIAEGGTLRGRNSKELAASLSISEEALRTALHRMLREFGGFLREEVRQTVSSEDVIEDEIRYLLRLFSG
ncbi:MAG: sigma-70 family RNA polymerase sigma factor [Akkermansiaceae bacterium]|nr:sigma-70 family RNA polymerase sigma factor [Akkermansiaceae bacterium]